MQILMELIGALFLIYLVVLGVSSAFKKQETGDTSERGRMAGNGAKGVHATGAATEGCGSESKQVNTPAGAATPDNNAANTSIDNPERNNV